MKNFSEMGKLEKQDYCEMGCLESAIKNLSDTAETEEEWDLLDGFAEDLQNLYTKYNIKNKGSNHATLNEKTMER